MEIYLRIAQLYLEEQDHVAAEAYINRAALLQSEVDRSDLQIIYKVCVRTFYKLSLCLFFICLIYINQLKTLS